MRIYNNKAVFSRRNVIVISFLLFSLFALIVLLDLLRSGFTTGSACGFGFGDRQEAIQEIAIRSYFKENLPDMIVVDDVNCSGFTDSTLIAKFHMSNDEAAKLVSDLEATFRSQEQYTIEGANVGRSRRQIGSPTDTTYIYNLSGFPLFDTRTVRVTIPQDDREISTVSFEGGNF